MPKKLFQWLVRGCQDKDTAGSGAEAKGAEATSATETIPVAIVRGCQDKDSAGPGAEAKGAEATSATETIPVASERMSG